MDNETQHHTALYVGQSPTLRYCPWLVLGAALVALVDGSPCAALILALPAVVVPLMLPWRFAVTDSGIGLWFGFGKYRFFEKDSVTVRYRNGHTMVSHHTRAPSGYMLTDRRLDEDPAWLRHVLTDHAFRVSD
jgi:hypothetical protein